SAGRMRGVRRGRFPPRRARGPLWRAARREAGMGMQLTVPGQGSGLRLHLWTAVMGAALFCVESWALGPLSWMYGYGGGLETVPTYLALAHGDRNFALWSPFVGGGLPRLAFWGNADPVSPEMLLFTVL